MGNVLVGRDSHVPIGQTLECINIKENISRHANFCSFNPPFEIYLRQLPPPHCSIALWPTWKPQDILSFLSSCDSVHLSLLFHFSALWFTTARKGKLAVIYQTPRHHLEAAAGLSCIWSLPHRGQKLTRSWLPFHPKYRELLATFSWGVSPLQRC